ncbi:MAG: hypothetical protein ABR564_09575, partial [Candidatus Dormibacteria bacterium]
YLPQLAVSPEGRLDLLFYDRRNDPDNIDSDVYYTYSTDGGRSVAPNRRLTSLASNSLVGPHYAVTSARGLVETGGRIGLLSERNRVLAAWTDTRNETRGPRAQDIFATDISFPEMSRPGWTYPLAAVLLATGLALLGTLAMDIRRGRARSATRDRGAAGAAPSRRRR